MPDNEMQPKQPIIVTKSRTEGILDIESALHQREDQLCGVLIIHWDPDTKKVAVDDFALLSENPEEHFLQYMAFWKTVAERAENALRQIPGRVL